MQRDDPMTICPPGSNLLLASLPPDACERLQLRLEAVRLQRGDVLMEPGLPMRHLYFPVTAVVSLLAVGERGTTTELALIGREGAVGVDLFLAGTGTALRAEVHVAGEALRIPAARLASEFGRGEVLHRTLLRYTLALIMQISQAVVCNRHHSVEQALCRWILMIHDRVGTDALHVTQRLIADSLGVRREGITEAAGRLQEAGSIRCARGLITVTDRAALELRSCECYALVARELERLRANLAESAPLVA